MRELVLINMPFADRRFPSFALSQLSALVRRDLGDEFNVRVCYMSHDFTRLLGGDLYDAITADLTENIAGLGDWLFRAIAFPDHDDNTNEYFSRYYAGPEYVEFRETLLRRRKALRGFCDGLVYQYGLADADVVGFTSMFAQTVPSLAMAQVIKESNPDVVTVMGGANCEAPMGAALAANVEQIDFIFSGPALQTFPDFLRCVVDDDLDRAHEIKGVVTKANCTDPKYRKAIGRELGIDEYFAPDFSAFVESFDQMAATSAQPLEPLLFFESSRGCWWGERAHCTFCGLNSQSMAFKSMTPEIALRQFEDLFKHSPWCKRFQCTDNIMPMDYLTEVFPKLNTPPGASLFYEVKVGLDQQDLQVMAKAGVTLIQPGIEALNTHTLKLMRKGTSVFQNLQFLKNCLRYGISPAWNLLIGFPGEPESTFRKYAEDLPLLTHLPPPEGCFTVRFDRYSPYYNEADEYGLKLHPVDYYGLVYPFPDDDLADLAYYFIDRGSGEYMTAAALWQGKLGEVVGSWNEKWTEDGSGPQLRLDHDADGAVVTDSRSGVMRTVRLEPESVAVLTHLERPTRLDKLAKELPDVEDLDRALAQLRANDLLLEEGDRAMSVVMMDTGVDPMPRLRRPTVVGGRRPLKLLVNQPADRDADG